MIDTYSENLKGELSFVKAENAKLSDEVENLMKMLNLEDSIRLQSNLEGLSSSLEFIQSQEVDLETKKADARLECSSMVEHQPDSDGAHGGCKFKIFYNCCNTDTSYKAASKLRLSIKYEDGDEMIVAHMVDEVDAFNKEPHAPQSHYTDDDENLLNQQTWNVRDTRRRFFKGLNSAKSSLMPILRPSCLPMALLGICEFKTAAEWSKTRRTKYFCSTFHRVQSGLVSTILQGSETKGRKIHPPRLECSSMVEHQTDSDGAHGGCKFKKVRLSIKYEDGDEMIVAHMVDEVDAFNKEAFLDETLLCFAKFELLLFSRFSDLTKKPCMILDVAALENLEVFENSVNGDSKGLRSWKRQELGKKVGAYNPSGWRQLVSIATGVYLCCTLNEFMKIFKCLLLLSWSTPNMGGKSILLRQVCLAVILAQVGADAPAESLKMSPVDRIFVRMGAKYHIMAG
ncbi:DNA mismatch repair protein MSH6 [Tanacetum coccineum]